MAYCTSQNSLPWIQTDFWGARLPHHQPTSDPNLVQERTPFLRQGQLDARRTNPRFMANSNQKDSPRTVIPTTPLSSPSSARRQTRRAITELSPPGKVSLRNIQHQPAHHPNDIRHHLDHRRHYRKHLSQDVRHAPADDSQHLNRHSIDMMHASASQQELGTSPLPSRRASILLQKDDESRAKASISDPRISKRRSLREVQKKADYRAEYVLKTDSPTINTTTY